MEENRALEKAEIEVDPTFKARSSKREPSRVGEGEWGKAPSEALACLLIYSSIFIMISANCWAGDESHNPGLCEQTHYLALLGAFIHCPLTILLSHNLAMLLTESPERSSCVSSCTSSMAGSSSSSP